MHGYDTRRSILIDKPFYCARLGFTEGLKSELCTVNPVGSREVPIEVHTVGVASRSRSEAVGIGYGENDDTSRIERGRKG